MVTKSLCFSGMERFREVYRQRFEDTELHCHLLNRITQGSVVIDHEHVYSSTGVVRAIATYVVAKDKITSVSFHSEPFKGTRERGA